MGCNAEQKVVIEKQQNKTIDEIMSFKQALQAGSDEKEPSIDQNCTGEPSFSEESPNFAVLQAIDDDDRDFVAANVTPFDGNIITPLIYAIEQNKPELAKLLLNQQNAPFQKQTALIAAIQNDQFELIPELKQECKRKNQQGCTALMVAAQLGFSAVLGQLKDGIKLQNNELQTALMLAAGSGKVDCVKLLLEEMSLKDKNGRTALMYAIEAGNVEIVRLLVKEKKVRDSTGKTALELAREGGCADEVLKLVM